MNNRDYLKKKRKGAGLTQRALAVLIGCSVDSVSLTALRGAMRQIMSDSYIQGSHDCADSLLRGKK